MDIASPVGSTIDSVGFSFLQGPEIKKLSVKQVVSPEVFDNLGHPVTGGLYDLALGAFSKNLCATCGLDEKRCMGHVGHIHLPVPAYNPMFFPQMYMLLRSSCLFCHHFRLGGPEKHLFECKLRLLQHGLILEASQISDATAASEKFGDGEEDMDNIMTEEAEDDIGSTRKAREKLARDIYAAREKFVQKKISEAIASGFSTPKGFMTPTIYEERKTVLKDLQARLLSRPRCDNCGVYSPKFRKDGLSKIFETGLSEKQLQHNKASGMERPIMMRDISEEEYRCLDREANEVEEPLAPMEVRLKSQHGNRFVNSIEICNIMRTVFRLEQPLCKAMFNSRPNKKYVSGDIFFANYVVVPPTRFRLPSELGDEIHMNPTTELLQKLLQTSMRILDAKDTLVGLQMNKGATDAEKKLALTQMVNYFIQLQNDYNGLIDNTKNQSSNAGANPLPGIKQTLERKEGLFRKNMMGKRVNYAARSVISPDPNIETNEIGVPPVFAVKLTYPEPVTGHNFEELRKAVINGPNVWPGATMVQNESGQQISLANMTLEQRTAIANQLMTPNTTGQGVGLVGVNKKVFRHIRNRDVVLMNRQPSLHKASMMGHMVRVLPKEKTLRLHYANTGAYNADFDGDEMNMHFPQNEAARAEAMFIANTNNQYLTPTSGAPLRGLIQDHISAGVWLTSKDSFYSREQYQQLIYGSVTPENGKFASDRVLMLPPAILKPQPMWTGKQIISTMMKNVCPLNRPGLNLSSSNKIKNEFWGASSEENKVFFQDGQLLIGILDKSQYGSSEHGMIHAVYEVFGADTAGLLLSVLGRLFTKFNMHQALTCGMDDLRLTAEGDKWRRDIIQKANEVGRQAALEVTNMPAGEEVNVKEFKRRLEEILRDDDKLGILDAVTQNKASSVTTQVVSTCIPAGTAKKFPQNSMQVMAMSGAKGSNVNVSQIMCGLGQQALEGRRVPVMVSGKTLPSFKPFDTHVRAGGYIAGRFYSGIRPQEYYFHCMAGREGLIDTAVKTSRSGYLQRCLIKQLEGVHVEYDNTVRDSDGTLIQFMYGGDAIDATKESYLREFRFCADNMQALQDRLMPSQAEIGELDDYEAPNFVKKSAKHLSKHPESTKYDPVVSVYNPSRYIGSVSDVFQRALDQQAELLFPAKEDKKQRKRFKSLMQLKYQQSTVAPGEQVGVVASQSIGEPSTQMTLNTFHFAGHGAANVTLGIPRMREIIMTASANIKTPQMVLPISSAATDEQADVFCKAVTRIVLSQLVDKVLVQEKTGFNGAGQYMRSYSVRVDLYTREEYESEYDVSQREVEQVLSNKFLSMLEESVSKEVRRQKRIDQSVVIQSGTPAQPVSTAALTKNTDARKWGDQEPDGGDNFGADSGDEESDNSDEEDEDVDSKKDNDQAASYNSEETANEEQDDAGGINSDSDSEVSMEDAADTDDSEYSEVDQSQMETEEQKKFSANTVTLSASALGRQQAVVGMHRTVTKFNFDDHQGEWCEFELQYPASSKKLLMVNLIEDLCYKIVVRETKNIERCLRPTQHKDGRVMVTEGVNFKAMWQEDLFVEVDRITSNDVAAVLHTYGVEAARQTIANEISNVFQTYAIKVNARHLDLIADMMTREGTFLPFSRQGLDSGTSPFLKMSFESTCQFLTKTLLNGDTESLQSPSARIVVGKPIAGGTGVFDVLSRMPQ